MKAIELIREMDKDSQLAEYGIVVDLSQQSGIKEWFGESAKQAKGVLEFNDSSTPYFAIWESVDETYGFIQKHTADAIIKDEANTIHLYKIES